MTSRTIVLAHGVLGFGDLIGLPSVVNYFNGVAHHLRQQGHRVFVPQVNPVGSIAQRGAQLAAAIVESAQGERVHILAHSMGGLDARHAITNVPGVSGRVATLVTIGTPHRGSPVADAVRNPIDPLFKHVPTFLAAQLQANAGALHDLTTGGASAFDDQTPDAAGVRYVNIAGNAAAGGHELFLFELGAAIGQLNNEVNDGLVTRTSALRPGHEHLPDWPVDHGAEVGWSVTTPFPLDFGFLSTFAAAHLARYDGIVNAL